jgi:hypothetical protein
MRMGWASTLRNDSGLLKIAVSARVRAETAKKIGSARRSPLDGLSSYTSSIIAATGLSRIN